MFSRSISYFVNVFSWWHKVPQKYVFPNFDLVWEYSPIGASQDKISVKIHKNKMNLTILEKRHRVIGYISTYAMVYNSTEIKRHFMKFRLTTTEYSCSLFLQVIFIYVFMYVQVYYMWIVLTRENTNSGQWIFPLSSSSSWLSCRSPNPTRTFHK